MLRLRWRAGLRRVPGRRAPLLRPRRQARLRLWTSRDGLRPGRRLWPGRLLRPGRRLWPGRLLRPR
ncbi:MAG: hypothetical protein P8Z68_00730, partial [Kineosporiaceae bacterium]